MKFKAVQCESTDALFDTGLNELAPAFFLFFN